MAAPPWTLVARRPPPRQQARPRLQSPALRLPTPAALHSCWGPVATAAGPGARVVTPEEVYWTLPAAAVASARAALAATGRDGRDDGAVVDQLRLAHPAECATAEAFTPTLEARVVSVHAPVHGRAQLWLETRDDGSGGGGRSLPAMTPPAGTAWQHAAAQAEALLAAALDGGADFDESWALYEGALREVVREQGEEEAEGGGEGGRSRDGPSAGRGGGGDSGGDAQLFAALLAASEEDDALAAELATLLFDDAELARALQAEEEEDQEEEEEDASARGAGAWGVVRPARAAGRGRSRASPTPASAVAQLLAAKLRVARGGGSATAAAATPLAARQPPPPPLHVTASSLQLAHRARCVCGAHASGVVAHYYHTRECHQAAYTTARAAAGAVRAAQLQLRERMRREYASKRHGGAGGGGVMAHLSDRMRELAGELRRAERDASLALLLSRNPALAASSSSAAAAAPAPTPPASARSAASWSSGGASSMTPRGHGGSGGGGGGGAVDRAATQGWGGGGARGAGREREQLGATLTLDLHGQHASEAVALLEALLPVYVAEGVGLVRVITGVGGGGDAPMRRQVHAWLHRGTCAAVRHVEAAEPGVLLVRLR